MQTKLLKSLRTPVLMCIAAASQTKAATVTYNFDAISVPPLGAVAYENQLAPNILFSTNTVGASLLVVNVTSAIPALNNLLGAQTSGDSMMGNLVMEVGPTVSITGFKFGVDNNIGNIGMVDVYQSGLLTASLDLIGDGNVQTVESFDLSAYDHVTKVEIRDQTDLGGIGITDIVVKSSIPEPSSGILISIALGAAAFCRKRA